MHENIFSSFQHTTVSIYDNSVLEYADFSGKSIINASQTDRVNSPQGELNQTIDNVTLRGNSELRTYGDVDKVNISNISLYDDSLIDARKDANLKNRGYIWQEQPVSCYGAKGRL